MVELPQYKGPSITDYDKLRSAVPGPHDNAMLLGDVLSVVKCSRATLYRKIQNGAFPPPADRIDNKSVWRKDEVLAANEERFKKFK